MILAGIAVFVAVTEVTGTVETVFCDAHVLIYKSE